LDINARCLDNEGKVSPELFPDLLHSNEAGYQLWADAVMPTKHETLK